MKGNISTTKYRALAELRYRIRQFLQEGDAAARKSDLEPQQYLMLLAIRGLPPGEEPTISTLAGRLALKHHTVVEMTDRLEVHGLVRRMHGNSDRRKVQVLLLPRGESLLEQVARRRLGELRATGAALAEAIETLVGRKGKRQRISKRHILKTKSKVNPYLI